MPRNLEDELLEIIQALEEFVWRNGIDSQTIEAWLKGFANYTLPNQELRDHALYLLTRFMYFGKHEIRELLRALYRDHVKYPIIADLRSGLGGTTDDDVLQKAFAQKLERMRFLGMGNPSESGTHLLYYFRQVNHLEKTAFVSVPEILNLATRPPSLRDSTINQYIFLDDFCGTGEQGQEYWDNLVDQVRIAAKTVGLVPKLSYLVLVGTTGGLKHVKQNTGFDEVKCVLELDDSFRAFDGNSRHFRSCPRGIDRTKARDIARHFGRRLLPAHPLGYEDSQLLLGFLHNTPDNTLPIFWQRGSAATPWHPVFNRFPKL